MGVTWSCFGWRTSLGTWQQSIDGIDGVCAAARRAYLCPCSQPMPSLSGSARRQGRWSHRDVNLPQQVRARTKSLSRATLARATPRDHIVRTSRLWQRWRRRPSYNEFLFCGSCCTAMTDRWGALNSMRHDEIACTCPSIARVSVPHSCDPIASCAERSVPSMWLEILSIWKVM
jgi:hypothetical protein